MAPKKFKLSPKENSLICITLVAGFFMLNKHILNPKRDALSEIHKKIVSITGEVERDRKAMAELTKRKPASVETGTDSSEVMKNLDGKNQQFSNIISSLAKGDGQSPFLLSRISVDKATDSKSYLKTSFSVDVEASFMAIGRFLEGLEESTLLMEVDSVSITRMSNELKKCTAKVKFSSYTGKGQT